VDRKAESINGHQSGGGKRKYRSATLMLKRGGGEQLLIAVLHARITRQIAGTC